MSVETLYKVGVSVIRNAWLKVRFGSGYSCKWLYSCPLGTKIRLRRGGKISIGDHLSAQNGLLISASESGNIHIGNNVNLNLRCMVVSHQKIVIGDNVIFGPDCKVFDHDHDYKKTGEERRKSFVTGDIVIGNGVWFGANCVVLRGTEIGDNCVFGAGCIIKGYYEPNSVIIQERTEKLRNIAID